MHAITASEIDNKPVKQAVKKSRKPQLVPLENPLLKMIGAGKGHASFSSVEEIDAFIRAERDAWD
jgi:hypothetical protein